MGRFHRRTIGQYEIVVLSDGASAFPNEFLMVGIDEDARLDACRRWGMDPNAVESNMNCVYIKSPDWTVLFDTGAGATLPGCGQLPVSMQKAGIAPQTIEYVIHTHLHLDHLGWNTSETGQPMFPNADYLVGETELAFWSDEQTHDALARAELWNLPDFEPAMSAVVKSQVIALGSKVKSFPDEGEPVPGITAIPAFGHTPGHLAYSVDLGNQTLVISGDLALSPFHLDRRDWYPAVDLNPAEAMRSRAEVFDQAAESGALVSGYHLPFPGLGYLDKTVEGWNWKRPN